MGTVYIDIETTGLNCIENEVIVIQMKHDNEPIEIYTIWTSNEKTILKKMINRILEIQAKENYTWCVGFNSSKFDIPFLYQRCIHNNISSPDELFKILYSNFVHLDLRQIFYSSNNWRFKGLGWSNVLKAYDYPPKIAEGNQIPIWYKEKKYDKIIQYIESEFPAMVDIYWMVRKGDIRKITN